MSAQRKPLDEYIYQPLYSPFMRQQVILFAEVLLG